jgi:hypothetical protein
MNISWLILYIAGLLFYIRKLSKGNEHEKSKGSGVGIWQKAG